MQVKKIYSWRVVGTFLCRIGPVAAAALVLRSAFPPFSFTPGVVLAWPLLFAGLVRVRRPFLYGIFFGAVFALSLASWVPGTLTGYYGLSAGTALLFYLAVIGLVPAPAFGVFTYFIHKKISAPLPEEGGGRHALLVSLHAGALFVLCEWLRKSFSPEHGWGEMGMAFHNMKIFSGIAPLAGSAGYSFVAVTAGALIWFAVRYLMKRKINAGAALLAAACGIFIFGTAAGELYRRTALSNTGNGPLEVALIHPGIRQEERWQKHYNRRNLALYREMSRNAFSGPPATAVRLIVWPETAVTIPLEGDSFFLDTVRSIGEETGAHIVLGAPSYQGSGAERRFQNSAYLLTPGGEIAGRYDKANLLPFAERRYFFMELLAEHDSGLYASGGEMRPLIMEKGPGGRPLPLSVFICYEAGMPRLIRKGIVEGARLLINVSNDAWFGDSSESDQALALLSLRCAEFHRPGLRSSGYGRAACIDADGVIIAKSGISGKKIITCSLALPPEGLTLYARFQGWFEMLCGIFLALGYFLDIRGARGLVDSGTPGASDDPERVGIQ